MSLFVTFLLIFRKRCLITFLDAYQVENWFLEPLPMHWTQHGSPSAFLTISICVLVILIQFSISLFFQRNFKQISFRGCFLPFLIGYLLKGLFVVSQGIRYCASASLVTFLLTFRIKAIISTVPMPTKWAGLSVNFLLISKIMGVF